MKNICTLLFLIQCSFCYSQKIIIKESKDTVLLQKEHKLLNDKIGETFYYKTLKHQEGLSKEVLFMRGLKFYLEIDSVKYYIYDNQWKLKEVETQKVEGDTLKERININPYLKDEFELEKTLYQISGQSKSIGLLEIKLKNNLPQDYFIELISNGDVVNFQKEQPLILSRENHLIILEIKIEQGVNHHMVKLKKSNGFETEIGINTIGYDILKEDFVDESKTELIKIKTMNRADDIYLEIEGNKKLLKIKKEGGEINLPVSKVVNVIHGNTLKEGEYILELINLETLHKQICKIKIED